MSKLIVLFCFFLCLLFPSQVGAKKKWRCGYEAPPAALRSTKLKQKQQNRAADKYNLSRIKDLAELKKFIAMKGKKRLVLISDTSAYYLDKNIGHLDRNNKKLYHHARVWVKKFLDKELTAGSQATGDRFKVAGLARTENYQKKLRRHKNNKVGAIAGKKWWQKSSHLTGATVDISFKGLSTAGFKWLQRRLKKLQAQGKLIAIQENCQGHFHIMILPTYK